MTEVDRPDASSAPVWTFWVGVFFFVLSWISPLFIPLVTASDWPVTVKTVLSGFLLVGAPELLSVISIIFLGRAGFERLLGNLMSLLRLARPRGQVSRMRYRIGLFIMVSIIVFDYLVFYLPEWIPGYVEHRVLINLAVDAIFIADLFVLGGDFWDKLRALFLYDAKACIPPKKGSQK